LTEKLERKEIVDNLLQIADKLFRELFEAVPRELLELDITMPQLKIMVIGFMHGPMRMSDLAADLRVTLATATGLIDRLVERGFIQRESQPDDRRVVLCRLSPEGQKTVSRIWETASKRSRELLEAIDTKKLQMLSEVLETMLESAEYKKEENKIEARGRKEA
jgi:DNA-binding MarR family transcriptional regulator